MVKKGISFLFESSGFLILGAFIALLWVNIGSHENYEHAIHPMEFLVNDVLMCMFFAIAAKEIREALLPGGTLSSPRKAALPLLATVGGMVGPALLYISGCLVFKQQALMRGWAIPCATDIAFSYLVARIIFGPRHPAIAFLLLLAVADDAGGLLILATCYSTGDTNLLLLFLLAGGALILGWAMNRFLKLQSFWPYLIGPGVMSWFGFYWGGIHPALALVPIIFIMPHARHDLGIFSEEEALSKNEPTALHKIDDSLNRLEHWWKNPVEIILGLFGLVNAGVALSSTSLPTFLVLFGLIIGKPLGIVSFTYLGVLLGLKLPKHIRLAELVVIGLSASIGFTVALFISTVAFPAGETLDSVKMGALLSLGAAFLVLPLGKWLNIHKI